MWQNTYILNSNLLFPTGRECVGRGCALQGGKGGGACVGDGGGSGGVGGVVQQSSCLSHSLVTIIIQTRLNVKVVISIGGVNEALVIVAISPSSWK